MGRSPSGSAKSSKTFAKQAGIPQSRADAILASVKRSAARVLKQKSKNAH